MSTQQINQAIMSVPTNNSSSGSSICHGTSNTASGATTGTTINTTSPYYPMGTINGNYSYSSGAIDLKHGKTIEFVEFLFKLLDIDLDYEQFNKMDDGERATFVRQHVINNIIK